MKSLQFHGIKLHYFSSYSDRWSVFDNRLVWTSNMAATRNYSKVLPIKPVLLIDVVYTYKVLSASFLMSGPLLYYR